MPASQAPGQGGPFYKVRGFASLFHRLECSLQMHFRPQISEYATFTRLPAGSLDPSSVTTSGQNMLFSPKDQVWFSDMPKAVSEYDGDEEEGRDAGPGRVWWLWHPG